MAMLQNKRIARMAAALALVALAAGVACAAGDGHADSGVVAKDFAWRILDFGLMIGILIYFLTKPIRNGLAGRREGIEKALSDAVAAREAAEAKFADYDSKLSKASAEIEEMSAAIRREGELERDRILANAREMAQKITAEAEKTAESEILRARTELRQEASRLAITLAEDLLKKQMTAGDQARLVDEYVSKVGELH
ncbi:MAG: ATP synthase F0 subunit B [Desulfuromonadales bacterium]|nr:ATP synthase F0 subunit B [Desulfuromonadales bacterium]